MRMLTSIVHWRPSLRLRLTLWMMLIFLVVQLSLIFVLQLYQRRSIDEFFHDRLAKRFTIVGDQIRGLLHDIDDARVREFSEVQRNFLAQRQFVVNVYDAKGDPLASSHPPHNRLPATIWSQVQNASTPRIVEIPQRHLHVYDVDGMSTVAGWMTGADGATYLLVVSWSNMYAAEMRRMLSGAVFVMIPIGLVSLMVSAYAISGIAEEPIRALRQFVRRLEPEFLGTSVPSMGGGQEVRGLQQDLDRTRQKLEAAFAAQERFMSNVSHELKTPISVMLTEAQVLPLHDVPKDVRAFVLSTIEELNKLGRMVESFLLLTRVRHGKTTIPNREACNLRDILMASYEACVSMAAQYRVRVVVLVPEGEHADAAVHGNCDLLTTVVDNLLRNAIRFSPAGFVVEVSGAVRDGQATITVRDYGPGIPADLLPRIFDRFSQSTEEQRRGRGHGLGLEIAMGITELHGGTIRVRNLENAGCEFVVTLPLHDCGCDATAAQERSAQA